MFAGHKPPGARADSPHTSTKLTPCFRADAYLVSVFLTNRGDFRPAAFFEKSFVRNSRATLDVSKDSAFRQVAVALRAAARHKLFYIVCFNVLLHRAATRRPGLIGFLIGAMSNYRAEVWAAPAFFPFCFIPSAVKDGRYLSYTSGT